MSIAQKLYEGIDIGSETVGLITYMRTDSTRLSDEYINSAYKYITEKYGKDYTGYIKRLRKMKMFKMHMKVLDQLVLCVNQVK